MDDRLPPFVEKALQSITVEVGHHLRLHIPQVEGRPPESNGFVNIQDIANRASARIRVDYVEPGTGPARAASIHPTAVRYPQHPEPLLRAAA